MSDQRIVLYDLTSKDADGNKPWSPSTWKIHILLRHLKMPYTTIHLDFPDLAPTFKALNIPANTNPDAHGDYTVPVLHFTNNSNPNSNDDYIMDSDAIIRALHCRGYLNLTLTSTSPPPTPSPTSPIPTLIHFPSLATTLQTHIHTLASALTPFLLPAITALLPPRSATYYRAKHNPSLPAGIASFEALRASTSLETCFEAAKSGILGLERVAREARQSRAKSEDVDEGGGLTWEEMTILALLAFLGRIDARLWEGVMGVAGEEAERMGEGLALGEVWCRRQNGGLVGEVFGN